MAGFEGEEGSAGIPKVDDQGLYAAESLLESRVDKEFDKFTAWMLRNPFELRGDREYVLVRLAFPPL